MSEVTQVSTSIERGEAGGAEELLSLAYDELRRLAAYRLAHERPGQTLQATALVHEAWLRLTESPSRTWKSKAHFFHAAAEAMRCILVDNARRKLAQKRGGGAQRVELESLEIAAPIPDERLLALDEALDGLAREDPQAAELVKLRFFVGLAHREAAELVGQSHSKADQTWLFAKAWLAQHLEKS
jgi:RNA polymerase sigma factor (TIGR02999 family)